MGKFVCHRTQQISERWSKPKTCIEKEHNREQKRIYLPAFGASYPSFRHLLLFCYRWPVSAERLSDDRNRKQTLWISLSLVLAIDSWEVFDTHPISQWLPPFLGFTIFLQNARIQQTITKRPPTKHNSFALAQLEWWFSLDTRFFLWPTQFDRRGRREKNGFYFSYVTDFRIEKQQKKIHHSPKRIVFLFFLFAEAASHAQSYTRTHNRTRESLVFPQELVFSQRDTLEKSKQQFIVVAEYSCSCYLNCNDQWMNCTELIGSDIVASHSLHIFYPRLQARLNM